MPAPWLLKFWHAAGRSCIDKYIAACPPCGICHWFCLCWPRWFNDCHNSGCRRRGWFFERAIWRNDFRIASWICPDFLFLLLAEFLPIRSWPPFDHYCAMVLQNVEKGAVAHRFEWKCRIAPKNLTYNRTIGKSMCITNPLKISDFQGNLLHMLLFSQKHAFYFSILRIKEGLSHVQQPLFLISSTAVQSQQN